MTVDRHEFVRRRRALADFGEFALRCEDLELITVLALSAVFGPLLLV